MTTVKELCLKYFSVDDATKFTWKCQCGAVIIQKKNTGWTNLANHIKSQHGEDPKSVPTGQATISFAKSKRVTSKGSNIYCWLNWVCSSLKPFSFVDDVLTREYTKLEPISHNSLKKYMELVTKEVEKRIQSAWNESWNGDISWNQCKNHSFAKVWISYCQNPRENAWYTWWRRTCCCGSTEKRSYFDPNSIRWTRKLGCRIYETTQNDKSWTWQRLHWNTIFIANLKPAWEVF